MLDATEDIFIIFPDFCLSICKESTYVTQMQTALSSAGSAKQPTAIHRTDLLDAQGSKAQLAWVGAID